MSRLVLIAILLWGGFPTGVQDDEWHPVSRPGDGFSVQMPARATEGVIVTRTPAGAIPTHTLSATARRIDVVVSWTRYPAGALDRPAVADALAAAADALVTSREGHVIGLSEAPVGTVPARTVTFVEADGHATRARFLTAGDRFFQLTVTARALADLADGDRFLESFAPGI